MSSFLEFPNISIGNGSVIDKVVSRKQYIYYMLLRCQSMFEYEGLPDTIPQRMLELYLQTNGHTAILSHEGQLYALYGGLGGDKDAYYQPTLYTISNPYMRMDKHHFTIGKDCIQIRNDSLRLGLLPMFERYAELISENDITMRIADINMRIQSITSADNDKTRDSAELYFKRVEEGKIGVVTGNAFFEGLHVNPTASNGSSNYLTQLIEFQQYLKASWFNDVGLQANYNMKRESINSHEAQMNNDGLIPLIEDMLNSRKEGVEQINAKFGTNISVELGSSWKVRQEEVSGQPEDSNKSDNSDDPEKPKDDKQDDNSDNLDDSKGVDDNE